MSVDLDQMPQRAEVQFNCTGTAVGKMRNELAVEMVRPFHESFALASDEGAFHGGDASAPPPLALFVADMRSIRAGLGRTSRVSGVKAEETFGFNFIPVKDALIASAEAVVGAKS